MFQKNPPKQAPSGMSMMLKALGIEFDPAAFQGVIGAVEEVRSRLQTIDERGQRIEEIALRIDARISMLNDGAASEELSIYGIPVSNVPASGLSIVGGNANG